MPIIVCGVMGNRVNSPRSNRSIVMTNDIYGQV